MNDDTLKEPVKTVEDEIAELMAEQESDDEENEDIKPVPDNDIAEVDDGDATDEAGDTEEDVGGDDDVEGTESADSDETVDDDGEDGDLAATASEEEEDTEKLEAPHHWSEPDKEAFNEQPPGAQEYILKRHKEMEGHFTRKNQEMSDTQRQYDAMRDALAPYEQEFARSGLDNAGAVRQLAHWHSALKTGGKPAVLELARMYGVDLSEPDADDNIDPALRQTQAQLTEMNTRLARQEAEAQQREQNQLLATIQAFETQTDDRGQLLHPHFKELQDTITGLYQAGESLKPASLEDAYNKALLLNPTLTAKKPKVEIVPKVNPAEKVKQAKKAATGVRSSGAVGKKERSKMTLEEEIASNMQ